MSLQKGLVFDLDISSEGLQGTTKFKDKTPYENNGILSNVTLTTDHKGKANSAGLFNGTNSYIDCGDDAILNFNTKDYSISLFFKRNTFGTVQILIDKRTSEHIGFVLFFGSNNQLFFRGDGQGHDFMSSKKIEDNNWHHLFFSNDRDGKRIFYIDGVAEESLYDSSTLNIDNAISLKIGREYGGSSYYFNGSIERPQIWNRVLSADEVKLLYESYNPCLKLYGGDKEIKENGFIRVDKNVNNSIYFDNPESNLYGKQYFYVMQYQARNNGGVPTSTGDGLPWTSISQLDAIQKSKDAGYHLITNWEWMAIARDIEQVPENWTGGAVGSGILKRGNIGTTDAGSYDGADPETGILNDKAKLKLSNGEEIYHFSGNVWEWVDEKIECGVASCPISMMPYDSTPASEWVEFTNISTWGKYSRAELGPLGNYNSANGVGKIYTDYDAADGSSDTYTHAFLRGGRWGGMSNAGVFALALNNSPSSLSASFGFRCARYGNE